MPSKQAFTDTFRQIIECDHCNTVPYINKNISLITINKYNNNMKNGYTVIKHVPINKIYYRENLVGKMSSFPITDYTRFKSMKNQRIISYKLVHNEIRNLHSKLPPMSKHRRQHESKLFTLCLVYQIVADHTETSTLQRGILISQD